MNSSATVLVQRRGNTSLISTINVTFNSYAPIFVTINGDIYVSSNESDTHLVIKWVNNATSSVIVMNITGSCFALFVDLYDNIYCSMIDQHKVVKRSFNDDINVTSTVGGTGVNGSSANMLSSPRGIFVTATFDLYVADCGNNRVQRFPLNQLAASTVNMNNGIALNCPTAIAVDADGYLFISDSLNNRIVGSGPNGFRCIVGCNGTSSSALDPSFRPGSLSFDSAGNLYVADTGKNRIQKINLTTNYCGESKVFKKLMK